MRNATATTVLWTVLAILCLGFTQVEALQITDFTEILYQNDSDVSDPAGLSALAEFLYDDVANILTIRLQNTSAVSAAHSAGGLLTGIGFSLPEGMLITSGAANLGTSSAIGFTAPAGGDLSTEWGYANSVDNGHFQDPAVYMYDTVVSTMVADTDAKFAPGLIENPAGLAGPEMGVLTSGGSPGGQNAIEDQVWVVLNLTGTYTGSLLGFIAQNPVAVTFGSPDSTSNRVPDAGATILLLGCGLAVLRLARQRR